MWVPGEQQCIQFDRFSFAYGDNPALVNISLRIPKYSFVSVVGPSGSGKSTLVRSLNRLIDHAPDGRHDGDIRFGDLSIFDGSVGAERARRRTGMVFERPNLFPVSVFENIVYPLRADGIRRKRVLRQRIRLLLESTGLDSELEQYLKTNADTLGMRTAQFVSFARALAREPDLLLLDAPCTFLDPPATARFEQLLLKVAEATTVVMSTHSLERAKRLSDYIVMLEDGQLADLVTLFEGQRQSFTARPRSGLRPI